MGPHVVIWDPSFPKKSNFLKKILKLEITREKRGGGLALSLKRKSPYIKHGYRTLYPNLFEPALNPAPRINQPLRSLPRTSPLRRGQGLLPGHVYGSPTNMRTELGAPTGSKC